MYQIVLTGPESTGKSTLAKALAEQHQVSWIPEYARTYLEQLGRPYDQPDLLKIAKGQVQATQNHSKKEEPFLFIDTYMLVMKVWSEHKYGTCDPWILNQLSNRQIDLYVLCDIDIPWEQDAQREHPHLRSELMDIYETELENLAAPYLKVSGNLAQRVAKVNQELRLLNLI